MYVCVGINGLVSGIVAIHYCAAFKRKGSDALLASVFGESALEPATAPLLRDTASTDISLPVSFLNNAKRSLTTMKFGRLAAVF